MLKQADSLHELIPCAAIKVPVLPETLRVITRLHDMKIAVNATACFTALQAKIAEDAGADFVSFFFNRMIDAKSGQSNPREHALAEISTYKHRFCRQAKVICGSIREPLDIQDCWANGADFVTASAKVIDRAVTHVKTTESVQQFQKDIEAWLA
jgi:transaldolase